MTGELADRDRRILDFADQWWRTAGAAETAIRAEFGMTATRYYQHLNRLLDDPYAEAYNPVLVHRLRRLRVGSASAPRRQEGVNHGDSEAVRHRERPPLFGALHQAGRH